MIKMSKDKMDSYDKISEKLAGIMLEIDRKYILFVKFRLCYLRSFISPEISQ